MRRRWHNCQPPEPRGTGHTWECPKHGCGWLWRTHRDKASNTERWTPYTPGLMGLFDRFRRRFA